VTLPSICLDVIRDELLEDELELLIQRKKP